MITRRCDLPDHSFFLFDPRGSGKTTWLKHVLPDALWFDLLRTQVVLAPSRQPESSAAGRGASSPSRQNAASVSAAPEPAA